MEKLRNNPIFQYLFVLCLSFALILSQTSMLHMHIEHDDHSSVASKHIIDVHIISILHDIELTGHNDTHHTAAIDASSDNLVNKKSSLTPLILLLISVGLFLYIPRLLCLSRQGLSNTQIIPRLYLIKPPLRAPPIN